MIAERPGYMGVMDSFVQQHAKLAGVPLDDDGMRLDVLEATIDALAAAGHTPKLLYLQSLFHNPRGQCYTRDRMLGLIDLCSRKKVLILNDEACASANQSRACKSDVASMTVFTAAKAQLACVGFNQS